VLKSLSVITQHSRLFTQSTHIRVLLFSPDPITAAWLQINGADSRSRALATMTANLTQVGTSPLFVTPWNPALYATGLQDLQVSVFTVLAVLERVSDSGVQVTVIDSAGRRTDLPIEFSLDGTPGTSSVVAAP
jgi:hypothetical protein